jgi:hypothetical protein
LKRFRWQPDALHESTEPWFGAKKIESRVDVQRNEEKRSVIIGLVEPCKSLGFVSEARMDHGNVERRHIVLS